MGTIWTRQSVSGHKGRRMYWRRGVTVADDASVIARMVPRYAVHIVAVLVAECGVLKFRSGRVRRWGTLVVRHVGVMLVCSVVVSILSRIVGCWRVLGDGRCFPL